MDLNKFTEKAQEALAGAQKLAARLNHQQIDSEHALMSLLDQEKGLAPAILEKAGVSVDAVTVKLQRELDRLPRVTGDVEPRLTQRLIKLIDAAESEAKKLSDEYVSVEHLLLAATGCSRPSRRCAATRGSPPNTRRRPTRRSISTAAT